MEIPKPAGAKDFKIYDLCIRALSSDNFIQTCLICITITYQLGEEHISNITKKFPKFNIAAYRQYFEGLIKDLEFMKFLEKRMSILSTEDSYQYFDPIETDDPQDIYNYDTPMEKRRYEEFLRVSQFIGVVMSGLGVAEQEDLEGLFG